MEKDFLVRNKNSEGLGTVPILWDSAFDSPEQQQNMSSESLVPAPCQSPWPPGEESQGL